MRTVMLAVGCLVLLGACGDGESASTTTTTAAPATITTIAATTTAPTAAPTAPATTVATIPTTTAAPTTTKATTATTASTAATTAGSTTTAAPVGFQQYAKVATPSMPDTSAPIPATGPLPNGVYYATIAGSGAANAVPVQVLQWFGGAACEAAAARFGDECLNDYYVLTTPKRSQTLDLRNAFVSVSAPQPGVNYRISAAELVRLLNRGGPVASTPSGYQYTPFGVRVEVAGGVITRFEQVWTP